jgi:hypothetical protein
MIYTPSPCLKGIDNMLFTLLTVEKKKLNHAYLEV